MYNSLIIHLENDYPNNEVMELFEINRRDEAPASSSLDSIMRERWLKEARYCIKCRAPIDLRWCTECREDLGSYNELNGE